MQVWQLQEPFLLWLLAYLNLNLDSEDLFCWYKQKKWFLLKTMEVSEAWPDIYDEGYTYQFQPKPTHKIH